MSILPILALVAAAAGSPAADAVPAPAMAAPTEHWYSQHQGTHWGLLLDAGAPDVSGLSLVYRPWRYLRAEAGGNFNGLSPGIHGGVTVLPFHWGVTPTLHFELGRMFDGDASGYAKDASAATKDLLRKIGYDYAQAQVGLEFGAQNRFVFFLRGGIFWLWTGANDVQKAVSDSNPGSTVTAKDISIRARGPSVNLGFLLYFF